MPDLLRGLRAQTKVAKQAGRVLMGSEVHKLPRDGLLILCEGKRNKRRQVGRAVGWPDHYLSGAVVEQELRADSKNVATIFSDRSYSDKRGLQLVA